MILSLLVDLEFGVTHLDDATLVAVDTPTEVAGSGVDTNPLIAARALAHYGGIRNL